MNKLEDFTDIDTFFFNNETSITTMEIPTGANLDTAHAHFGLLVSKQASAEPRTGFRIILMIL